MRDSPGYDTPWRFYKKFGHMTPQSLIPPGDRLTRVSYPGEIDSPGYHIPGRLTHPFIIPQEVMFWRIFIDSLGYHTPGSQAFFREKIYEREKE